MNQINLISPILPTERLIVRMANYHETQEVVRYYQVNRDFHRPFDIVRPESFWTDQFWQIQIETNRIEFECDRALRLFLYEQAQPSTIVGAINFTEFFRYPSYSCRLGYSLAEAHQGKGYMQEALAGAIAYLFTTLNLHRIMACYMPRNQRSGNLLRRLGFGVEGYARDYLLINGRWEDHILTSLINPHWLPPEKMTNY
jgi:[ribosomal protein S5]-alanine N-acetyltransferase